MEDVWKESKFSVAGFILGSMALLLAVFHFWAGPFAPQPKIETTIAETVLSIRDATRDALNGVEPERELFFAQWDADKTADVVASLVGALAIILAVLGYTQNEPKRTVGGAAVLGTGAIAFQFAATALMMVIGLIFIGILVSVVLSWLPFDMSP